VTVSQLNKLGAELKSEGLIKDCKQATANANTNTPQLGTLTTPRTPATVITRFTSEEIENWTFDRKAMVRGHPRALPTGLSFET
jgi:hypothetical protein